MSTTHSVPDLIDVLAAIEAGVVSSAALTSWPLAYRAYRAGYAKSETAADRYVQVLREQFEQAAADADRFFEYWQNPGRQLTEVQQRRIDQALAEAGDSHAPLTGSLQVDLSVQAAVAPRRTAA